jgi:hypothetical protein
MKKQPPKKFLIKEHATHARMIYNASVWQQLPHILAYPLKGYALPVIIFVSLLLWVGLNFLPLGAIILMIVLSWTLKYAYAVLENTIFGHSTPPMFSSDMWFSSNQRPLKQLFFLFTVFGITGLIRQVAGDIPALFVFTLALLLMPASAVIIAIQDSLFSALNPLTLILLAKRIGSAYIIVSLLFSLPMLLFLFFPEIPLLFRVMGFVYLLFMTFHFIGFIVYHRRESLGLDVSFSPEREVEAQKQAQDKQLGDILYEVHVLARGGRVEEAIEELFARLPELGDTFDNHAKIFARLTLWEEKSVLLAYGQYYISQLIQQNRLSQAVEIYQDCFDIKATFAAKNSFDILPLATTAYREQRYPLTRHLVQDFQNRHPNHPDIIAIKLLTAKLLAKHFKRYQEAKAIMVELLKYKEHALFPEIKKYAMFLQNLIKAETV